MSILPVYKAPTGWRIVPVHYSADPEKDEAWVAEQKPRFRDEVWQREVMIDFGQLASAPAYSSFNRAVHVADQPLLANHQRPLLLAWDFNIDPMAACVSQNVGGSLHVLGEIVLSPGTIEDVIREFRNRFPYHRAGLQIYGDAAGHGRSHQSGRSSWDLVRLHLGPYASQATFRVPTHNPGVVDRVNAMNLKLRAPDGAPGILISPDCKELIRDLAEVRMTPDGKSILKSYKADDPYSARTHVSDALGYLVAAEFGTFKAVSALAVKAKPRPPLVYAPGALLGYKVPL